MKEMIITATFKGQDGSLGYKTGTEYKLRMTHVTKRKLSKNAYIDVQDVGAFIDIQDTGGHIVRGSYCQYESMISFLQNWENVKDITAEEKKPKRDKKEIAINFTDFCKRASYGPTIKKALAFYNEEFQPEKVLDYFQNWSLLKPKQGYKNGVVLTNNNSKGWKVKIWTNDGAEYIEFDTFRSGTDEHKSNRPEKGQWIYYPRTMSEFISDCLRYEDVELLFTKTAIKKIYG